MLGLEIGNFSESNNKELLAYTNTGKVLIFSLNGELLFKDELIQNQPIWKVILNDINKDSKKELIIGGMDGLLRIFHLDPSLILKPLWAHQFGSSISGILINDINNDDDLEIIAFSLDKSLRILNSVNGKLIWGQIFAEGIEDASIWEDPNNYKKHICACGNDGTIRVFQGRSGELLWYKRFTDKIRSIDHLNSKRGILIVCGGDDRKAHFVNINTKEEIKTIEFNDYVWKILSFPSNIKNNVLIYSYSFAFFDDSIPINDIHFTSKLICIDDKLNLNWEIQNKNVETMNRIRINQNNFIAFGTTKGELIIIDEKCGESLLNLNISSSVNDIKYESKSNLLISCHDNGTINAFFIEES